MRVLHVLPSLDQRSGGPIRAVLQLSRAAEPYGMESEVVGVGELAVADNPLSESAIISCPSVWLKSYAYSPRLWRWLQQNIMRFDGVVLHGMWRYPNIVAAKECLRVGVPYICVPHGMLEPWAIAGQGRWKCLKKSLYWGLAEESVFEGAAGVVFATSREHELARSMLSLHQLCTVMPPFGVDEARAAAVKSPSAELGKIAATKYVLFLGRIHPKKNLPFLFTAWAQARIAEGWRLVVAGPAEKHYLAELKNLLASLKIEKDVTLLDFVSGDDKIYLLENAKWLVLPSMQENFGIVVMEAVQRSCPVAMSHQVFLADEMKESAVIMRLQLDDWVGFFHEKMTDESYRRKCIERSRAVVFSNYSIQSIAKLWVTTLRALFCHRRAAG